MTKRRLFLMLVSVGLAAALIILLIKIGKVDLRVTMQQLKSVSLTSIAKLVLLNVLMVCFSTEKWRTIDAAWRRPSDLVPSRTTSYALTSVGLAIGIVLPLQLAMATARTLGTYFHGGALKRGTGGTLLEQGFDVYTVCFLAAASAMTWYRRGGAKTWAICASISIVLALLAVEPAVRITRWLAGRWEAPTGGPFSRRLLSVWELLHSGILHASLARRLVVLSVLRTGVVVLMSIQTAEAVGLNIPFWRMAAAIPFVSVATIVVLTPGGLGLNDLAGAGALRIFGTPFATGAQWVLANRVLVSASYLLLAACAAGVLGVEGRAAGSRRRDIGDNQ